VQYQQDLREQSIALHAALTWMVSLLTVTDLVSARVLETSGWGGGSVIDYINEVSGSGGVITKLLREVRGHRRPNRESLVLSIRSTGPAWRTNINCRPIAATRLMVISSIIMWP
jgi:hypothetical protein